VILIDLNIILDVVQNRQPHYHYSAKIIDGIIIGKNKGAVSIHSVTTLHYLVNKYCGFEKAQQVISWLLQYFEVISLEKQDLLQAYALQWKDFEDAVTAIAAKISCCDYIITRNVKDFCNSPVLAITPENFIILNLPS